MAGRSLFDKIWDAHVVTQADDGSCLLYVDRHLLHEGSRHAFNMLRTTGRTAKRADRTFAFADHYVPTSPEVRARGIDGIADPEVRSMIAQIADNCGGAGIKLYGIDDPDQGIVHVVAPEQGLIQPGMTVVCGDSHTSTHGAFGCMAFGIGSSEVGHVLATQTLWQRKPRLMRVVMTGDLERGVTSKDLALALIARIGTAGGTGHAIEFVGSTIDALGMEARMTLCNLSVEAGARMGMIAPDDTTFAYLEPRARSPKGEAFARAVAAWRDLPSDPDAAYDRTLAMDASEIQPIVTWGTSPEDAIAVTSRVPRAEEGRDEASRARIARALEYMGLGGGEPMLGLAIDRVFLGSCTNARIEDLRAAAAIVEGRRARIPAIVVAGSRAVQAQAEAEGLADVFRRAGFEWREPGCSMCLGTNGDILRPRERCASTSNRNFEGRQGPLGRTHLMSPAMAAAAAVHGAIVDVREVVR